MSDNNLHLQYASQTMQYTTQFIASISDEEVVLDCGSVVVPGDQTGDKQLPIHTRMAMPWSAAVRLHRLLGELIESRGAASTQTAEAARAALPPLSHGDAGRETTSS